MSKETKQQREIVYQAFQLFLAYTPKSGSKKEAEKSISNAREFLVGQQLNVGKYYLKRNNPAAAIRRFKKIKKTTKVSSFLPEVSYRLIESFLLLGLSSEARSEGEYMRKKFSNSSWTAEATRLIDKLGLD